MNEAVGIVPIIPLCYITVASGVKFLIISLIHHILHFTGFLYKQYKGKRLRDGSGGGNSLIQCVLGKFLGKNRDGERQRTNENSKNNRKLFHDFFSL